eukprot:g6811.t1
MYRAELHVKAVMEQTSKGLLYGNTMTNVLRSPTNALKKKKARHRNKVNKIKDDYMQWMEEEISTPASNLSSGKPVRRNSTQRLLPQLKLGGNLSGPSFDFVPNFSTEQKNEVLLNYEIGENDEEHLFALPKLSQKLRNSMKVMYLRGLNEPEENIDTQAVNAFWHRGPKNVESLKPGARKVSTDRTKARGIHHWKLQAPAYYWRSYRQDVDSFGVQMHTTHQVLLDHDSTPAPPINDDGKLHSPSAKQTN